MAGRPGRPRKVVTQRLSLREYAIKQKRSRCWICQLPEDLKQEILAGREAGHSTRTLAGYLVDECNQPEATRGKVEYHFQTCPNKP